MVFPNIDIDELNDLMEKISHHKISKYVLSHKVSAMKYVMIYLFFLTSGVMTITYASTYVFMDHPLTNPFVGDYDFHMSRAKVIYKDGLNTTSYYSPLFHIMIGTFANRGVDMAIILIAPLLIYIILPLAFFFMCREFHDDELTAIVCTILYFFTYNSMFYVFTSTFPQALVSIFLCLIIMYSLQMFKNKKGSLFAMVYFTILGFLSHPEGGFLCVGVFILALLLKKKYKEVIITLTLLTSLIIAFRFLITRMIYKLNHLIDNVSPSGGIMHLIVKMMYFVNPITIYYGVKNISCNSKKDYLIIFVIAISLLMIFVDDQYRTILIAMMFLNVYAGRGLVKYIRSKQIKKYMIIMFICAIIWVLTSFVHIMLILAYLFIQNTNIV